MPPANNTSAIIGMTITTGTNLQSPTVSAVEESNHRKMNQRRMLQLMQHPPPPPPLASVLVRNQPTTDRRSLMSYTGEFYEDNDDSVSSCSMEVMSVNDPYAYYNHSCGESSFRQQKRCCGSEDDEENSTTDSTGSADDQACFVYYNDPENRRSGTRRLSQRPQQMARILACSSPEITALCKSSFQLSNQNNDNSNRRRLQKQVSSDMMSIGSYNDTAHGVSSPPPDVLMESTSTLKSLFLPPLCSAPALERERTAPELSTSPVRTDNSFPRQSNPPTWTDAWLRDGRSATVDASAELIPSSSSETDDPHSSFRSSSYPMFHYSDSCISPNGTSRSARYYNNGISPQVTLKSLIATSTIELLQDDDDDDDIAVASDPLSKLSLHRRLSNDKLPSWNEIVLAATATTAHSNGGPIDATLPPAQLRNNDFASNDASRGNISLEKLVLQKNLTVVSDETMR